MAPASTMLSTATMGVPLNSEATKTTSDENSAEPAERPSMPSMRLKAFVIHSTHRIVSASERNQASSR